jgi:hypothetical protein
MNWRGAFCQFDAGALQQEHKGRGRAVQDGHFLGRDVHIQVVDAQAGAGRHQVLDRGTLAPPLEAVEAMRVSVTAAAEIGMSTGTGQVDPAEHDAGVRGAAGRSVSSTRWPLCSPRRRRGSGT